MTSKNSTGSGAADAEPRETSADPGSAPSAPEPSWNAVAPGVERTGHLTAEQAVALETERDSLRDEVYEIRHLAKRVSVWCRTNYCFDKGIPDELHELEEALHGHSLGANGDAHKSRALRRAEAAEDEILDIKRIVAEHNAELSHMTDRVSEALFRMLYLYSGYTVSSRGPVGLIHDCLRLTFPKAQQLLADGEHPDALYRRFWPSDDELTHTCINTATTVDGRPPPPCAACRADPEFMALLDAHNAGFTADELARIPPPPVYNVDPSPWVPEVGDRVLCGQNQIGTIERIAPGASLNIWVKFDNAATRNFSAHELQRVRRLPPPQHFVTVETLLAAIDEVAGEAGYGGPAHFVFRNLADEIRERTKP